MCKLRFLLLLVLVGGVWVDYLNCGLWCYSYAGTSTGYGDNVGARLLNLIKGSDVKASILTLLRSCRRWLGLSFLGWLMVLGL